MAGGQQQLPSLWNHLWAVRANQQGSLALDICLKIKKIIIWGGRGSWKLLCALGWEQPLSCSRQLGWLQQLSLCKSPCPQPSTGHWVPAHSQALPSLLVPTPQGCQLLLLFWWFRVFFPFFVTGAGQNRITRSVFMASQIIYSLVLVLTPFERQCHCCSHVSMWHHCSLVFPIS